MSLKDVAKLRVLERISTFLKSPAQVRRLPSELWQIIRDMKVEYKRASGNTEVAVTEDEERLEKLQKLKGKNKLTKKKERELIGLSKKIKKSRQSESMEETDRRLRREVKREMAEAEGSQTDNNNIKRQIILKVFYLALKIVRNYVMEDAFDGALEVIRVFVRKADKEFYEDVLQELSRAYESVDESAANASQKRLLIMSVVSEISRQKSTQSDVESTHILSLFHSFFVVTLKSLSEQTPDFKRLFELAEELLLSVKVFNEQVVRNVFGLFVLLIGNSMADTRVTRTAALFLKLMLTVD